MPTFHGQFMVTLTPSHDITGKDKGYRVATGKVRYTVTNALPLCTVFLWVILRDICTILSRELL